MLRFANFVDNWQALIEHGNLQIQEERIMFVLKKTEETFEKLKAYPKLMVIGKITGEKAKPPNLIYLHPFDAKNLNIIFLSRTLLN